MSHDLEWLLLRKGNSFMVKRLPEGPIFSRERGNLLNLHSHKYSGLANSKTIDIQSGSKGNLTITTRRPKSAPNAVADAHITTKLRPGSNARRTLGIAAGHGKRGYRPDLRKVCLARVSALHAIHQEQKEAPPKKVRGKKKAAASKA